MFFQFIFFFLLSASSRAQESASNFEYETTVTDIIFNSSSKVVIDEKTIKESKSQDLVSLITTQANITLFNNNFQPPQLFLRGAESSHILIMIDDVPVYDVSWAQRTLNLNSLDIANVRRIEILKGGQTVLHGGQALAGVIKIYTFSSQYKNQYKVALSHAPTQYPDHQIGLGLENVLSDNSGFAASARLAEGKNQSPVLKSKHRYDQKNQNLDLSYEKTGATTIRARGFYFRDRSLNPTTVNGATGQSILDSDVVRQDDQLGASVQFTLNEFYTKPRLSLFGQRGWRFYYSDPNSADVNAKFRSQLVGALLDLTPLENSRVKVNAGLSYQKEDFFLDDSHGTLSATPRTADEFSELMGAYAMAQVQAIKAVMLLEAGARIEKASDFSEKPSFQLGMTLAENTKLEWVTGYRAPSSAQIKGVFPNPDLKPEISQTYSITQDLKFQDTAQISATVFETSFDNYIETRSLGAGVLQYQNTAKVKTRGLEFNSSFFMNAKQSLQATYAYQEPWDQVRHQELRRRPKVSGSLRFFQNEENTTWMLEGTGSGERHDFFGNYQYKFPGYFLLNAAATYRMDTHSSFALRVSNLLDYRPEISIDYYGEGRNFWLSYELTF
jgi:iron complex outermembrane recepter protein